MERQNGKQAYTLEFIGRTLEALRDDMKAMKEVQAKSSIEANEALQSINKQLASLNVKILAVRGRVRNLETDVESLAAVVRNGD